MKHKLFAFMFAVLLAVSTVVGSVSAFAEDPAGSSSATDEFLDSYFSDWEEAGEQAIELRDALMTFLNSVTNGSGLNQILGDAKEIPIAWLRATKSGLFALTPADNIYYWLVNHNLIFDDRSSGESVKKTVDVKDPTIYVPSPWIQVIKQNSASNSDITSIFSVITSAISNFLSSVLTPVIKLCTSNALTLIFLGVSFIGIGIRYTKRVTNAFGRGR